MEEEGGVGVQREEALDMGRRREEEEEEEEGNLYVSRAVQPWSVVSRTCSQHADIQ